MARWRLVNAHYLNVPDTEWEYQESDRNTGANNRKRFPVGRFLDPNDPSSNTPRGSGEVIVCHAGKGIRSDWTFSGDPTPEMEPVDEEAEAISKACAPKWKHPIDSLPGTVDFSQSLIAGFEKAMMQVAPQPNTAVSQNDLAAVHAQMAELMAKNAELEARLTATASARRA